MRRVLAPQQSCVRLACLSVIRRQILLLSSVMPDFAIAVDLGGTNLRIAAVSTEGRMLEKIGMSTNAAGPHHVIDEMCDAIQRLSHKHGNAGSLIGAGIGIPGIIDLDEGVVRTSANLPGWENYPVRAEIE